MHVTHGAGCHANVTSALLEFVAVRHHVAAALAAFAAARSAPTEGHRSLAIGHVFAEVDSAERRLVALIEAVPGIEVRCRREMVRVDGIAGDVRAWAATLDDRPAEVIDHPLRFRVSAPVQRPRRQAKKRAQVNRNLRVVADDAPAAC